MSSAFSVGIFKRGFSPRDGAEPGRHAGSLVLSPHGGGVGPQLHVAGCLPSTARVAALPPRLPFPDSPELGDWAWERRRELFGRD